MSSVVQSRPLPSRILFMAAEAFLAFAGAGIAGTLWWADQTKRDVPCSADGGCEIVNASRWSHVDLLLVHHVPVALLGLLGYVALLSLAMLRLGTEDVRWDRRLHLLLGLISAGGVGYSWFLQWIAPRRDRCVLHLVPVLGDCHDASFLRDGFRMGSRAPAELGKTKQPW